MADPPTDKPPNSGCGALVLVAIVAFALGRCSMEGPRPDTAPQASSSAVAPIGDDAAMAASAAAEAAEEETAAATEAADTARLAAGAVESLEASAPSDEPDEISDAASSITDALADEPGAGGYTDVDGHHVRSPAYAPSAPDGASARCRDGSYSFSHHRRGTCSRHGGVAEWL